MPWLYYALAAALALAAADILVKFAAGKIPNSLGMLLYGSVPFLTGLIWVVLDRPRWSPVAIKPVPFTSALGVGLMFTFVTFCMYAAFRSGAPISLASPLIRLGGLIVAGAAGLLLFKEPFTTRYLLGLALVGSGMYLVLTR